MAALHRFLNPLPELHLVEATKNPELSEKLAAMPLLNVGGSNKNHDKDESYDTSSIEKQKRYIFEITQSSVTAMSSDSNKTPQLSPSQLHHDGSNDIELKDKIDPYKTAEIEAHQRTNQYFTEALCENVDMISLWVSPIIFIIFSIVYWSMYF